MTPFEIVAAPLEVWLGTVGAEFPDVDETPHSSDGWILLGTSGDLNYTDKGVTVTHDQKISEFIPAGSTGPRKAWRTEEHLQIDLELADVSAAQYAQVLNDAAVSQHAAATGNPGYSEFDLLQGLDVAVFALLARGLSPADDAMAAQYQVPIAYQSAAPKPVYAKGAPALLAVQFDALVDDTSGFGTLVVQTAHRS